MINIFNKNLNTIIAPELKTDVLYQFSSILPLSTGKKRTAINTINKLNKNSGVTVSITSSKFISRKFNRCKCTIEQN